MRVSLINDLNMNSTEMSQLAVSLLKMIDNIKAKTSVPLPEPTLGKHHPNELDRLLLQMRKKYMKLIINKCEKLPNMEFKSVLEELEGFYNILLQLEQEVNLNI